MDQLAKIPWKAWYGDEEFSLSFPSTWKVRTCTMDDAPEMSGEMLAEAFERPIGTPKLRDLARGKKNAAIVMDDITRPTKGAPILKKILEELDIGGIPRAKVKIIFALGAHRPMMRDDMIKKVGKEIYDSVDVMNHYAYENLVDCGKSRIGTPIKINRDFMESELKLSVSCVEPHEWAGFGGGAKNILPGVSGIETLEANHRLMAGKYQEMTGVIEGNKLRADIEDIARSIGLDATVNVVTTASRGIAGVFVGDMIQAHRAGINCARNVFATEMIFDQDIVILNAYPKDTEITQITNAFNILFLSKKDVVKKGGTIVITSACPEGRGYHSLCGHGTRLAPRPENLGALFKGRHAIIFSPNLSRYDVYTYFPQNVLLFNRWEDVLQFIMGREKNPQTVAIFPTTPLQLPKV
jgi:nickel-dependent lactate racemase